MINYFNNQLMVLVIFQAKMSNMGWYKLLKCEDSLPFFIICDRNLNIFGFWTVGQTNRAI